MSTTKKANGTVQQAKTENKNLLNIDASVLDALNALNISESVKSGKKEIFKSAYKDKALRTKYRNLLIKTQLVEVEKGKTMEVQKGLIPVFLMQIKKGDQANALKTFAEISEICKTVYVKEDSFEKAEDYFSGNRSESTQNILKAFISVAQSIKA